MSGKESPALAEGLRVTVHRADVLDPGLRVPDQAVVHREDDLPGDREVVLQEEIVHLGDGPLDRVLDRKDRVRRVPCVHGLERIAELKAAIVYSGKYWLTEFGLWGSPVGSAGQLEHFLTWAPVMFPDIERYYLWTNRSDPNCCSGWPFELVDGNGNLTAMGQVYADWTPPAVSQAWFPVVSRLPGGYPPPVAGTYGP